MMDTEDEGNVLEYKSTRKISREYREYVNTSLCWKDRLKDLQQIIDEEKVPVTGTVITLTGLDLEIDTSEFKQVEGWWECERKGGNR